MKKIYPLALAGFCSLLLITGVASAHSVVSPSQTTTSKYETFSLGVPSEKDMPTIAMRLLIPVGVDKVMPYVKAGWKITVTKDGDNVTQIEWTGGSIPAEEKDAFLFSARTAPAATTLIWKAYQTYADGTVVAWDRDPQSLENGAAPANPYSMTDVVADASAALADEMGMAAGSASERHSLDFSIVALALSAVALAFALKKK